jgi:hypothetical protein
MSVIAAIASADAAERMRRFAFLVIVAAALYAGYLFVPSAHASYSTVLINDHRGVYNAPYLGAATALLTSSFLSLFGFFFVRGSVRRDWELHVDAAVASSPVPRTHFLLGKWLSNLGVLLIVAAIAYLAAFGMQQWYGEARSVNLVAYVLPFVVFTVPALAFVSAIAVVLDVLPLLRGIVGGVLYVMFIWMAMLAGPFQIQSNNPAQTTVLDPLGTTPIVASFYASERAAFPNEKDHFDVDIGGGPVPKGGIQRYRYGGIAWTPLLLAVRAAWLALSLLLVLAVSPLFDRYRRDSARTGKRTLTIDVSRIIPDIAPFRALRAEFGLLVNGANSWWMLGAIVLAVATGATPPQIAADFILPVALIWPLERISTLGAREHQHEVFDILAATPGFTLRNIAMQWIAGTLLSTLIVAGYVIRLLVTAQPSTAIALICMIAATVAAALLLGTFARTSRAFQALFLIAWYLGPIQHLPELDVANAARLHPALATVIALAITVASLAAASVQRRAAVP